jgi:hypothetical protein
MKNVKKIFLFLLLIHCKSSIAQNQINGYDYITNLNTDANYGNIDFFVRDAEPCSTTNEKSVFGFNAISLNPNKRVYLNFKVQVTDCFGKIYEQSISIPLYKLSEGFTENIVSWSLSGKLTMLPYQIAVSNNSDRTKLLLKGQLKPTDPDSLVIKTRNIMYGKYVDLEIIGGDDLTNSQNTYWSWRIGSPNAQEVKTQSKQYSFIAESNTTVYVNAVSTGPNNNVVTSQTVKKNVIVDTKSQEIYSKSNDDKTLTSTSKNVSILSNKDTINSTEKSNENLNKNVNLLRGKNVNLYKEMELGDPKNFLIQVRIHNAYQENGIIKIILYTLINEPDMYLEFDCTKDGFNLHKSSFFGSNKTVYNIKLQNKIREIFCTVSNSDGQKIPKDDFN